MNRCSLNEAGTSYRSFLATGDEMAGNLSVSRDPLLLVNDQGLRALRRVLQSLADADLLREGAFPARVKKALDDHSHGY